MNLDKIELSDIRKVELSANEIAVILQNGQVYSIPCENTAAVLQKVSYLNGRFCSKIEAMDSRYLKRSLCGDFKEEQKIRYEAYDEPAKRRAILSAMPISALLLISSAVFPEHILSLAVLSFIGFISLNSVPDILQELKEEKQVQSTLMNYPELGHLKETHRQLLLSAEQFLNGLETKTSDLEVLKAARRDLSLLYSTEKEEMLEMSKQKVIKI